MSEQDLRLINQTSIEINDDSGDYWGSLEVFHHLHCLVFPPPHVSATVYCLLTKSMQKVLRHYMAKDYYPDVQRLEVSQPGDVYPEHIG